MALPAEVAYGSWLAETESLRQKQIVQARAYYDGEHDVRLTERQKEFLGYNDPDGARFALNYCGIVVDSVTGRLIVKQFTSSTKNEPLEEWARELLAEARFDQMQREVHQGGVNDGEHFVIVDWDEENKTPRLSPHQRYTSTEAGGDGFGCKGHYPDNDPSLPMRFASKRWTAETWEGEKRITTQRMNLYYPDRVEAYEMKRAPGGMMQFMLQESTPWVDPATKQALGIPVVHFRNPRSRSELWDAIPPQDAINKTALDLLAMADTNGWGFLLAKGVVPTTDEKTPAADGSNYIKVHPGMWLVVPEGADIERIAGDNPGPMIDLLDTLVIKLAQITDTPINRFQASRMIAGSETLKQQDAPLIAKIEARQVLFGNAWEDVLSMARRLDNAWGKKGLDEEARFESEWESAEVRDQMADEMKFWTAAEQAKKAGVPLPAFLDLQGWDKQKIAKITGSEEYRQGQEMRQAALDGLGAANDDGGNGGPFGRGNEDEGN